MGDNTSNDKIFSQLVTAVTAFKSLKTSFAIASCVKREEELSCTKKLVFVDLTESLI